MSDDSGLQAQVRKRGPKLKKQSLAEKLQSQSPSVRLEAYFQQRYLETQKIPYYQTSQLEDRKNLKQMAEQLGEEMARDLIDDFFAFLRPPHEGGDLFLYTRAKWGNVRDLNTYAGYLLQRRRRGEDLHPKTAENLIEGLKAMGKL